jgi:hypothetical protein
VRVKVPEKAFGNFPGKPTRRLAGLVPEGVEPVLMPM